MDSTVVFLNGNVSTVKEAALAADARLWGAIALKGGLMPTKVLLWNHLAIQGRQKLTVAFANHGLAKA